MVGKWTPGLAGIAGVLAAVGVATVLVHRRRRRAEPPAVFKERVESEFAAVGRTEFDGVRVWWRVERSEAGFTLALYDAEGHRLARGPCAGTALGDGDVHTAHWPGDVPGAPPLAARHAYHLAIEERATGREVARVAFRTPPHPGSRERVCLALTSCHQPFDRNGRYRSASLTLLAELPELLRRVEADAVLLLGDQIYADEPLGLSLYAPGHFAEVGPAGRSSLHACAPGEVRELFEQRYRVFWSCRDWRCLLAGWPTYSMIDDHEVIDNFGSHPDHATAAWASVREGALDAAYNYQLSRVHGGGVRPQSMHYTFDLGPLPVFVMDLRSTRRHDGERIFVCDDAQLDEVEAFLERERERPAAAIALSIPLAHVPTYVARLGGWLLPRGNAFEERWVCADHSRARLVRVLQRQARRAPGRRILLLGGDVHSGAVSEVVWSDGETPSVYQLTSSAVSNLESTIIRNASRLGPKLNARIDAEKGEKVARLRVLPGTGGLEQNPTDELNVGLVEVDPSRGEECVRFSLLGPTRDGAGVIYQSRWF
jgi:alkaline phosphatase D